MEKSVNMKEFEFNIPPVQYSPLNLAYIGDAVYEVYIRTYIMRDANIPVSKLHRASTKYVSAKAQADIVRKILDKLSEEELGVYKRGRNAHSHTSAKNADIVDYRMATGLEALIGYIYIKKDFSRLEELIKMCVDVVAAG